MDFDKIIWLPIYHQTKKIGYDYSKRTKGFTFLGLAEEMGE